MNILKSVSVLALSGVMLSTATMPALAASRVRFPQNGENLEVYDNSPLRAPIVSRRSVSNGVIDSAGDVDYRQVVIKQDGTLKVYLKSVSGNVTLSLMKGSTVLGSKNATSGQVVSLSTSVTNGDTIYIKVTGDNSAQYRIFTR